MSETRLVAEAERFWPKVDPDPNGGCWEWTASKLRGYGQFGTYRDGRAQTHRAHRFAYELLVGPIPDGLTLDHLCRNRGCVYPGHLEPATNAENVLRGEGPTAVHARKTHCIHGHEFTPENTYLWRGQRKCRACLRIRDARRNRND